ncbi:MAG: DUF177 domain-containing protein [Myxococcota bacterium]
MTSDAQARNLTLLEPLRLRDIPSDPLRFSEALPAEWLRSSLPLDGAIQFRIAEDGSADVTVSALGPVDQRPPIRVCGRLHADLQSDCVRCLDPVAVWLRLDLDQTLFSQDVGQTTEPEETYDGETIPLPDILREALTLELPMNPMCEDEGACDARTHALLERVNRPAEEAMARTPGADPRWAALAHLKRGQDG